MPRKPLTEEEKDRVRRRACRAGRMLLKQKGANALTIRAVAQEIGMSAMSLYTYFNSKTELVAHLQADAMRDFAEAMEETARDAIKPDDRISVYAHAYAAFARDRTGDFLLAFQTDEEGRVAAPAQDMARRAVAPLKEALHDMAAEGLLDEDPDTALGRLWSEWHGHAVLSLGGCEPGVAPDPTVTLGLKSDKNVTRRRHQSMV